MAELDGDRDREVRMNDRILENLDRLADELFPCSCETCACDRQARMVRDLEIKYGCATEYMLMRIKLATN